MKAPASTVIGIVYLLYLHEEKLSGITNKSKLITRIDNNISFHFLTKIGASLDVLW